MRLFLYSLFVMLGVTSFATAGETDEPLDPGLEEQVSVTASRTPIPVRESGNSISILSRAEIEARGYPFVADLLRGLPGLSVSRSGPAGSQTQIRVRGAEANHVLVRIDGVDVSDVFGADEVPFELLTSEDIERIEFVRGPQSGLWGSDAIAGVIDIVTRSDDARGGSARIETGSFGTTRSGGRFGTGSERLRFEAAFSQLDTDGTNVSRQGQEDDGTENTTVGASLRWDPDRAPFDLDLSVRHTHSTSDFDDIDFVTTGLPTDAVNSTGTDLTVVRVGADWNPQARRWHHGFSLSSAAGDAATTLRGTPDSSTEIDKIAASFQSAVDLGAGQLVTLALDHERRDFSQRGTTSVFGDPNQKQAIDNSGLAVEYRFHSLARWAASASVRRDHNSDFDDVTTFRLTGALGFNAGKTRLRAAAGSGQKAPTFLDRFGFFTDTFLGNPDLKPEKSRSFEIGIDQQIGKRARIAITYFDATLEDEINGFFFDGVAGAFTAVNENGESDRRGLELAFDTALGERIDVLGSYTYTDATDPDGVELRRPKHVAFLAANWRSTGNRVRVRGSLNHSGTREDLYFPPFPQPSQRVVLDSYLLADVNVTVAATRRIDLIGRVENLFDEEYEDVVGFRASGVGAWAGLRFRN